MEPNKKMDLGGRQSSMLRPLPVCVNLPGKLLSIHSVEGLPTPPVLPMQSCTNIDKVDKEMLQHAPERLELKSLRWGAELHTDASNPLTSSDSLRSHAGVLDGYFLKICWFGLFEDEYLWHICVSTMENSNWIFFLKPNGSTDKTHIKGRVSSMGANVAPSQLCLITLHIEFLKEFKDQSSCDGRSHAAERGGGGRMRILLGAACEWQLQKHLAAVGCRLKDQQPGNRRNPSCGGS